MNQRVWLRKSGGTERFAFYDLNGQRLAEYTPWVNGGTLYFVQVKAELYFGGKRIRSGGYAVAEDRLGSTRRDDTTASRFFPWGEENGSTANDRQKFATYYRDAGSGLDYANQRYYSATIGRLLTADPYMAGGGPADPGSWNRYGYVQGDPVNRHDPSGLFWEPVALMALDGSVLWGSGGGGGLAAPCFVDGMLSDPAFCRGPAITRIDGSSFARFTEDGRMVLAWADTHGQLQYEVFARPPAWGVPQTKCHTNTLNYLGDANISVGTPEFGAQGGIRWQVTGEQKAALEAALTNAGWIANDGTGLLHRADVGWPNMDYRSFTGQYGNRSIQVVVGQWSKRASSWSTPTRTVSIPTRISSIS